MELELYVKKGVGSIDDSGQAPTDQKQTPKNKKKETKTTQEVVAAQVVNLAKQGLMMGIRNYGDITGRAREQQSIETAINIAGTALTFAVAGPLIGSLALGVQSALNIGQSVVSQRLENRQVDFNNRRLGAIISEGNR